MAITNLSHRLGRSPCAWKTRQKTSSSQHCWLIRQAQGCLCVAQLRSSTSADCTALISTRHWPDPYHCANTMPCIYNAVRACRMQSSSNIVRCSAQALNNTCTSLRVMRSSSPTDNDRGSHRTPPLAPPKGRSSTAERHVTKDAKLCTCSTPVEANRTYIPGCVIANSGHQQHRHLHVLLWLYSQCSAWGCNAMLFAVLYVQVAMLPDDSTSSFLDIFCFLKQRLRTKRLSCLRISPMSREG